MTIPYELKKRCVDMYNAGNSTRAVYDWFCTEHTGMHFNTFRGKLRLWRKSSAAPTETLDAGTYPDFIAHGATVQVDANGDIVQAWIKQRTEQTSAEQILDAIRSEIKPVTIENSALPSAEKMLEIPLFDMHFGVADYQCYCDLQTAILERLAGNYSAVAIIIGQDLFHSNDFRSQTAKGTKLQQVDFCKGWRDAWLFWCPIIEKAIANSGQTFLLYSMGNHDETPAWCFVQALAQRYPQMIVNDEVKPRKAFCWEHVFIGYGHCEYTGSLEKIFRDFVCDYPNEFAEASVREIHTGHMHRESCDAGIMVRRLASAVPVDKWSDASGFASAHKRFQIFEWWPSSLYAVYYL